MEQEFQLRLDQALMEVLEPEREVESDPAKAPVSGQDLTAIPAVRDLELEAERRPVISRPKWIRFRFC